MRGNCACASLVAWGLAIAVSSGSSGHAQSARALRIDTAGQSLATALTDIARRSGRELLIAAPTIGGRAAPPLRGQFTIDQALSRLLVGSGLTYRRTSDGTYIVYAAPIAAAPEPETPVALPELLVTGRKSQNTDIRRSENDIQAYKVWSSRDVEQAHSTDIDDFLRSMATGDAQIASALQDPSNTNASNRSEVNLRGMGSNQTLVLVDGRRMPGLPPGLIGGAVVAQADINGLPLAAIDRVEILNSTAGGIYGAGATAGVINIVLKRDYHGADLGVTYGITDRGDAPARRIDGRVGFSPDDGRTDLMIAFGLLRAGALSVGDRDYEAKARARRFANDPAELIAEMPISGSVNIISATGANLSLDPAYGGASLGATSTFAPAAYRGAATDGGALLLANAGHLDTSLSPDVSGARRGLLSKRNTASVIGSVRHRFSPAIEAYADVLILRNDGQAPVPEDNAHRVSLPADAPTNPFQQPVYLSLPLPGFDAIGRTHSRTMRATVGMIADLPHGWKFNVDYSVGEAKVDSLVTIPLFKVDYFDAIRSGQLDPLSGRQAFLSSLAGYTYDGGLSLSQANHFRDRSIRLAGPLLDLGGGPLTLTLTAEDQRERVPPSVLHLSTLGPGSLFDVAEEGLVQSARHYYAELRAPLTSRYAGPAGLRGLELQLALRHEQDRQSPPIDASSTADTVMERARQSATVYTAGFKVFPISWLMLRASASSGFLPPVANQLGSTMTRYTSDLEAYEASKGSAVLLSLDGEPADPKRGGQPLGTTGVYDYISGGSTNLQPERARSLSAGVVLTPLDRLRVSVDYTRIDKRQEIVDFHGGDMAYFLQHEDLFPGRVTRATLTEADRAKGYSAGVVTAVDTTSFNIGRTLVEAVDIQSDYLFPTTRLGDFRLRAATTWQPRLRRQTDPQSAAVDYVGYADGPLAWRANGGADWSKGGTTLGFNVSVYGGYRVYDRLDGPDQIKILTLWQGGTRVPAQAYVNLFATRQITFAKASGAPRELEVRFGVQNVLDHSPPVLAQRVEFGLTNFNYSTYGDPRRRRFDISLVGHF
jgi:iron complex outermembrane receptor protein